VSGQIHAIASLPPLERATGTRWLGGWVETRNSLNVVTKRKDHPCRVNHSHLLAQLSYVTMHEM